MSLGTSPLGWLGMQAGLLLLHPPVHEAGMQEGSRSKVTFNTCLGSECHLLTERIFLLGYSKQLSFP